MEINDTTILQRILLYKSNIESHSRFRSCLKDKLDHSNPDVVNSVKILMEEEVEAMKSIRAKMEPLKKRLSKEFWDKGDYMWGDL